MKITSKLESNKYSKNSKNLLCNDKVVKSLMPNKFAHPVKFDGVEPFNTESLTWSEERTTRNIDLELPTNQNYEFDVDLLYSWEQSSGTISYGSARSNFISFDKIQGVKKEQVDVEALYRTQLDKRFLHGSAPPYKILTAKSLGALNAKIRQEQAEGHLTKIIVECKKDGSTERRELISKMCDDAIHEFMTSLKHDNKLLKIKLHCGGELLPRTKICGIRAQQTSNLEEENDSFPEAAQNWLAPQNDIARSHNFQHLSTCSPALPYPSVNSFKRCSIEEHVKQLKERWKVQQK